MITTMLHGMAMALADSVPGVSGGTVAFILGFYKRFLGALHDLICGSGTQRRAAFRYLFRFGLGWAAGMGASVLMLSQIFEKNIYFLSSAFLGLTIGAIPFILWEEGKNIRLQDMGFALLGTALVAAMTAARGHLDGWGNVQFQSVGVIQCIYLMICGVLAISAMLLPGISGSTLLLIFGVYIPAVSAVKELLHLHLEYLPGVLALGIGVLGGIFLTAGLIREALAASRSKMLCLILGLMLGSLYPIIQGPATLAVPKAALSPANFQLGAFLLGVLILAVPECVKYSKKAS